MPRKSSKNPYEFRVFDSAAISEDRVCVAFKNFDLGEPHAIILASDFTLKQPWDRFDVLSEVVSVCVAPPELEGVCEYIALTSDGIAVLLASEPRFEPIVAENDVTQIAPGKGPLSAIHNLDGRIFATGHGGQVHERGPDGTWRPLAARPPLEEVESDDIEFLRAALLSPQTFAFGGLAVPTDTDEALAAAAEQEDDALVDRLLFEETRDGYGTLWLLDKGRWRKAEVPATGRVKAVLPGTDGGLIAAFGPTILYRVDPGGEARELLALEESLVDMKRWSGDLALLHADDLLIFDGASAAALTPPPPASLVPFMRLHTFGPAAVLVGRRGLARLQNGVWTEMAIPPALLQEDAAGGA